MSYSYIGLIPDLDPMVTKLEEGVKKAKIATAKAQIAADKYQLRQSHWDKLSRVEQSFQRSLRLIDKVAPQKMQGMSKKIGAQVGMLTAIAALGLIGSTLLLHVWVNSRRDKEEDEAEELEDDEDSLDLAELEILD